MRSEVGAWPHSFHEILIFKNARRSYNSWAFSFNKILKRMKDTPNNYGIIPAKVRYSQDLTDFEKLLFVEITALTNPDGYCFASNKYLGEIYDKSESTISRSITKLEKFGFIAREVVKNENGEVIQRKLYPLMDHLSRTLYANLQGGIRKNDNTPIRKNAQYNNKNTINNKNTNSMADAPKIILQTISSFYEEVKTEMHKCLSKRFEKHIVATVLENQIKEFIEYWSVREFLNSRGQKIKSLALTVSTWCKNGDDWGEVRKMYDRLMGGKSDGQNGQIRYSKEEPKSTVKYDRVLPKPKLNKV